MRQTTFKAPNGDIWEDTGFVRVGKDYIQRIYRVYKDGDHGFQLKEDLPIKFDKLQLEARTLAEIIGNAQSTLSAILPHDKNLTPIIEK